MGYCKLTICFEDPFWIGLVETEDDDGHYQVAKHTFGPEPTDPQICEFIASHWNELDFTAQLQVTKIGGKRINHKRMQRIIEREVAAHARRGTKAQQAIAEERESSKLEKKHQSKEAKEAETKARFNQRTAKRKKKHRGH